MKIRFLLGIAILSVGLWACGGNKATETPSSTTPKTETTTPETKMPKITKAPVSVNPSTAAEYPEVARDLGFPVHPAAEVANVGNAILEGDGLFMRLHIAGKTMAEIEKYYDDNLGKAGWVKEELKIFKGADKAMRYLTKDGKVVCRMIAVQEPDHIKIAVTMRQAPDLSKHQ